MFEPNGLTLNPTQGGPKGKRRSKICCKSQSAIVCETRALKPRIARLSPSFIAGAFLGLVFSFLRLRCQNEGPKSEPKFGVDNCSNWSNNFAGTKNICGHQSKQVFLELVTRLDLCARDNPKASAGHPLEPNRFLLIPRLGGRSALSLAPDKRQTQLRFKNPDSCFR